MRYEVRVADRRIRYDASPDGRLLVDGRVAAYEAREIAPRQWSVILEGTSHEVVLLGGDPPRVRIDGHETVAFAIDERALAAHRDRAVAHSGRREIRAPMPGLLKAVHVKEGDVVERDAALATLEAMKMENELRAPARAKVQRVAAAAGGKIESGSLIAVLIDEPA